MTQEKLISSFIQWEIIPDPFSVNVHTHRIFNYLFHQDIHFFFICTRLPVGGFRSIVNQPFSSQRTSVITLPREINSTGTSTTSSKLSDSRILREVREKFFSLDK